MLAKRSVPHLGRTNGTALSKELGLLPAKQLHTVSFQSKRVTAQHDCYLMPVIQLT